MHFLIHEITALTEQEARVEQEGLRHERETNTGQAESEKSSG